MSMSNQTGIKVSSKLTEAWKQATASDSRVRIVKVSIINESLEEDGTFDIKGTFEEDFGTVHANLAEKQPSYFFVRLDTTKSASDWLFLCYVPDVAPIRQKMIYAATRASLTKELGDSFIKDSIYGTNMNDFTLDGYKKHRASLSAPKPLTERERQLAEIAANEKILVESMKGGAHRKSHAPGMSFPLTERAVAALKKLLVEKPAPAKPKVVVASAVPKKFSSPVSTPLPVSPVITAGKTVSEKDEEEPKKHTTESNVEEDEWDDDETAETKKVAVAKEEEKKVEEVKEVEEAVVVEEEQEEAAPAEEEVEEVAPVKQDRSVNFVKLVIDSANEQIELAEEAKIDVKQVNKKIDEDSPRFTFFAYEHTHKGTEHDSLVFMYTCPSKSKIRERMLYSSCRAGVLEAAKNDAGLTVDKKLETTDVSDLTEAFILEELHPVTQSAFGSSTGASSPRGFSKPARPGARRVM
ncbi:Twinfilin-1 [Gryganskiella cystojenkinii]|nr:Twinfilin-1 [Gryganskiella cystojenkinii]